MSSIKFKTISFKAGTYVFVEEQSNSSEFYIVKQGTLIEENPLNNLTGETDQIIRAGDFFGVFECMSQRDRLCSVRAIEDSVLIVVHFDQFELLISHMAPVALKIIRYFSNRLRKYNATLANLAMNIKEVDTLPHNKLFQLGQFYTKMGEKDIAAYAYKSLIHNYPNNPLSNEANELLQYLNYDRTISEEVSGNNVQQTFEAGTPIFLEAEPGHDLYIILEGRVKITQLIQNNEVLLGMLKEKDIFGEMAILENSPRSASAIAVTKVVALKINKQNFELYIRTHPTIAKRIIQLLSDRIWVIYKRLATQLISDPLVRLYDAFHTLVQKNRAPIAKGVPWSFDMSPTDIVQFAGLDPIIGQKYINHIIATDSIFEIENGKLICKDVYNIRSTKAITVKQNHSKAFR